MGRRGVERTLKYHTPDKLFSLWWEEIVVLVLVQWKIKELSWNRELNWFAQLFFSFSAISRTPSPLSLLKEMGEGVVKEISLVFSQRKMTTKEHVINPFLWAKLIIYQFFFCKSPPFNFMSLVLNKVNSRYVWVYWYCHLGREIKILFSCVSVIFYYVKSLICTCFVLESWLKISEKMLFILCWLKNCYLMRKR